MCATVQSATGLCQYATCGERHQRSPAGGDHVLCIRRHLLYCTVGRAHSYPCITRNTVSSAKEIGRTAAKKSAARDQIVSFEKGVL
jgi:hypothetical protein